MTPLDLSLRFFLQVAVVLGACRLLGVLSRRVGQPQVVAEMVAGILLGPSVLGYFAPEVQHAIFPDASRPVLYTISQLGVVLYMFLVGVTFDSEMLRTQARSAAAVSIAGIVAPFALGVILALSLIPDGGYFVEGVQALPATLFLGAAMSITAFPVLARIVQERGLHGTPIGTLVLAAGSIDDAAAWCMLALVVSTATQDATVAAVTIGGGILYAALVLTVGRRALASLAQADDVSDLSLAVVLMLVMAGAAFTEWIGMHGVFGAFLLGVVLPRGAVARGIQRRVEPFVVAVLLPLFFVYSGLNTRLGLLDSIGLWGVALIVLIVASAGKVVACAGAAAVTGAPWRSALAIGALMNARGLVELIMLNIGLERGIITPTLFSIMVLMAVATTLAASPLYGMVMRGAPAAASHSAAARART